MRSRSSGLALLALILFSLPSFAMDLPTYMDQVVRSHRGLESWRLAREAAAEKREAGDLGLVPVLTLKGSYLSDKKLPNQLGADEFVMREYSLGLAKNFSTGTSVALSARATGSENTNITNPAMSAFGRYAQGGLGISLSQSLWKDGFGRATRLRREREEAVELAEVGAADLQSRQILTQAESLFWDSIFSAEEAKLRRASLTRAEKIVDWIRRRVRDGISDRADLLSAQALVASRQLQLTNTQDDLTAFRNQIRDQLELSPGQPLPELKGDLTKPRRLRDLLGSDGRVVRLDVWLAELEAKAKEVGALEAEDSTRADLKLAASYNTNSYEPNGAVSDATREWNKSDRPTAAVGLTWTYLFDTSEKTSATNAARQQAMAARAMAIRKSREGETAWKELERRHLELTRKIEAAENLQRIQAQRAAAQAEKLSRGRAITLDVVNSEQDAAEAESQLVRLRVERRKLEAQTRLFVVVKE